MANTLGKKVFTVILMAGMLALSACAKKDSGAVRVTGGRGSGVSQGGGSSGGGGGAPTQIPSSCSNSVSPVGKIYDPQYQYRDFRPTVVSFVSATLEQQYVGQISGDMYAKTGIDFQAKVRFDDNGEVIADQSQILISIFDSFVNTVDPQSQQLMQAYRIFFGKASGGQMSNNGQYTVKFQDEYGEVTLTGSYSSSQYSTGTVSFANYTNVNGGQPTSGQLGSFTIRTCGMF
ncbi:hypothetical protein D3C87_190000 [compost metagenome]